MRNPYTIAIVSGDTPPSLQGGWLTDLKRSSIGQAVSNVGDAIVDTASTGARMTSNVYADYIRPVVSVNQDAASTLSNVLTGEWGKATEQIESGFKDTLSFIQRQKDGTYAVVTQDVIPEVDTGVALLGIAALATGAWMYYNRKNKKRGSK